MGNVTEKYVIFRDDDISYFTRPEWLEKLYKPLFENGKSVSLSVIPEVIANARIGDADDLYLRKKSLTYQPFIPPDFRGRNEKFLISENQSLLTFVEQNKSHFEILQHGLCHEFINGKKEFKINDEALISARVKNGKKILTDAFGHEPMFFVPPWDSISQMTLKILKKNFKGVSLAAYPHHLLPRELWLKFLYKKRKKSAYLWWDSFLIVHHRKTFLSRFASRKLIWNNLRQLFEIFDVLVVVNHHWEFFFDWEQLDEEYFSIWQEILDFFLRQKNTNIIRFAELYDLAKTKGI